MSTTRASTTTTTLEPIQIATSTLNYYASIILLIVGIIGCLCNFITFTAPQLRKTSCAFYFLQAAIFELLSITFGLISRFAGDHLGSTLLHTDRAYCKLRAFLVSALPLAATYFILLSSIDRSLASSVHANLRSFSQTKIAFRATIGAVVLAFLSCAHILVAYDLRPRCATMPGPYAMFDSMFVVFWLGVIPHVLMLIFGFLTLMNIRRTKKRIAVQPKANVAVQTQQQRREQKTDVQLILMMLFQVGFSSVLILTRMIYYAYYVLAPPLTGYDRLIGSFLSTFTIMVYYGNYTKSFYIYTLSSQLFRSIFMHRIKFGVSKTLGRRVVNVLDGTTVQ